NAIRWAASDEALSWARANPQRIFQYGRSTTRSGVPDDVAAARGERSEYLLQALGRGGEDQQSRRALHSAPPLFRDAGILRQRLHPVLFAGSTVPYPLLSALPLRSAPRGSRRSPATRLRENLHSGPSPMPGAREEQGR